MPVVQVAVLGSPAPVSAEDPQETAQVGAQDRPDPRLGSVEGFLGG